MLCPAWPELDLIRLLVKLHLILHQEQPFFFVSSGRPQNIQKTASAAVGVTFS
jgi:hypothetical protein